MPRIDLAAVSCEYRGADGRIVTGIHELELTIADREWMVVLGASGAGKTTLLRLIAGLESPSAGEVRFDGACVNGTPASERDAGMVFQTPALFPHLTVRENLALGLILRRAPRDVIREAVGSIAVRLSIESLLDRRPPQLSGGEQQRVALGRALIRQPGILLLDEPLSSLDAPLRRRLRADLRALHAESATTTIYVTHDPGDVAAFDSRTAILDRGRLLQVGSLEELRARPASEWVADMMDSGPLG